MDQFFGRCRIPQTDQQRLCAGYTGLDTVQKLVSGRIIRAVESLLESKGISRTMAFKNQSTQPKKRRPVVSAVVNTTFKCS